ncbi:ATP-binding protein [Streptomyces sp. NPDC001927]
MHMENTRTALDLSIARRPSRASTELSESDALWPGRLRQVVRASFTRWGCVDVVETAELLLTELLTNALRHATGPDVRVRVYLCDDQCVIEVNDGSPRRPELRNAGVDEESGRGLLLVDAMADSWGTSDDGTTTWCAIPLTERTHEMALAAPPAQVLHETALPLPPNSNAIGAARVNARTLLTIMAWPGPHNAAVDVLHVLVRNAVEHGLAETSAGRRLEAWLRINERLELLIDVQDHTPDFPRFDEAVRGELGRGLWGAQRLGAELSWFPDGQGKTVRATLRPCPVDL